MSNAISSKAKDIVRLNNEEIQGRGNFQLFETLFADDFFDFTHQVGFGADKASILVLYKTLREAFPDLWPEIHQQWAEGNVVTTYKTYHGTHKGSYLGVPPSGKKIVIDCVDVMEVRDGQIISHRGAANLLSFLDQVGALPMWGEHAKSS